MRTIDELCMVEPREATISINDIRTKISSIKAETNHEGYPYFDNAAVFNAEVFLCLANKIHELEQEIDKLKS